MKRHIGSIFVGEENEYYLIEEEKTNGSVFTMIVVAILIFSVLIIIAISARTEITVDLFNNTPASYLGQGPTIKQVLKDKVYEKRKWIYVSIETKWSQIQIDRYQREHPNDIVYNGHVPGHFPTEIELVVFSDNRNPDSTFFKVKK